jgi:twitching motility protein PilI
MESAFADTALLSPTAALNGSFANVPGALAGVGSRLAPTGNATEQRRQGFRIGPLDFMVRYEDGSELTDMLPVHRLPNAPQWFCGIANLHGMLIPVFDLSQYIGVERDAATKPMLLVLSHGADAAGILIDGLPERLRWQDIAGASAPDVAMAPPQLSGCVIHAISVGGRLRFDLDCFALLQALERAVESAH